MCTDLIRSRLMGADQVLYPDETVQFTLAGIQRGNAMGRVEALIGSPSSVSAPVR